MFGQVSAAPNRRRAGNQVDHPDVEKRHHGAWSGACYRGRYPPGVDRLAAAAEHLPALRAGLVVQPAGGQAELR